MSRLLVVNTCQQCPHSQGTSACFHPDTPGRADEYGRPPLNDGSGHRFRCFRGLPDRPGQPGPPECYEPPDWCPLPKV